MFCGNCPAAAEIAACTSLATSFALRLKSNCKEMLVLPVELVELKEFSPAMLENCLSSGAATEDAIVSGVAPGKLAETEMKGYSTLGKALIGNDL